MTDQPPDHPHFRLLREIGREGADNDNKVEDFMANEKIDVNSLVSYVAFRKEVADEVEINLIREGKRYHNFGVAWLDGFIAGYLFSRYRTDD